MTIKGRNEQAEGPIRYGMVGGGQGAFIGGVHRIAARMDGEFALVAGRPSVNPVCGSRKNRSACSPRGVTTFDSFGGGISWLWESQ